MATWLLKSEPSCYSLDTLRAKPRGTDHWDGVRNYQARNFLRAMQVGDEGFFYHSSCAEPGVVGLVEVVREAYPDPTAWDPESDHYDPRSTPERPLWFMVDVRFVRALPRPVTLARMREEARLMEMPLLRRGNRLSVLPVTDAQRAVILELASA
jgi:predicted RNA-binding protein with PUA-like domain